MNANTNVWQASSNTPLYPHALGSIVIDQDIQGQSRPSPSNPGADHVSIESIRFPPLTANDVGPNAFEDSTSLSVDLDNLRQVSVSPVPADAELSIQNLRLKGGIIRLIDINGQLVLSFRIERHHERINVQTASLAAGVYFLQIYSSQGGQLTKKIMIRH
ncbi:MAG: T9SS type A sorting domain-containing protein [Bacteroidota bacterium]